MISCDTMALTLSCFGGKHLQNDSETTFNFLKVKRQGKLHENF